MHLVKDQDQLEHIEQASVHIQDARDEIRVATDEAHAVIQGATEAMVLFLKNAIPAMDEKDFRIHIEEEINIIERP
jgi:hypothetical protein